MLLIFGTVDLLYAVVKFERALAGARTVGDVLGIAIGDEVADALEATGIAAFLAEPGGRTMRLGAKRGDVSMPTSGGPVPFDAPLPVARAATSGNVEVDEADRSVAIPFVFEGEHLGAAVLQRRTARPSDEELDVLGMLGSLTASALAHARSRESESTRRSVIRSAGEAISKSLSMLPETYLREAVLAEFRLWPGAREEMVPDYLKTVLRVFVEHAKDVTDAQFGALGIGESPEHPFSPWVSVGVSEEEARAIGRVPRPVGVLGAVAHDGETIRVEDVKAHPAFRGLPRNHPEVTSFLGVPVRYRGVSLGNLYLGNKRGGQPFSAVDQEAAELLASLAAIALQQAYLRISLDTERSELRTILETAPHGIVFVAAATGKMIASPRAVEMIGQQIPAEGPPARETFRVLRPDGTALSLEELPWRRAFLGESVTQIEFLLLRPDGGRLPVLLCAAPLKGLEGEIAGAVVSFADVSAYKELERLREEFVAVVAHDLRNPIQAILFHLKLLESRARHDEAFRAPIDTLQRLERNVLRLGQMTDDLLDASRIELHRVRLDREQVHVVAELSDLIELLRPLLGGHQVHLDVDGPVTTVWADPLRFSQIVTNLVENAAKFSPEDAPIRVRIAPAGDGVQLSVADEGIGIAAEEIPRLFDRFHQGRRVRERKTGLGLGLYITKGLLEAHGGSIRVESTPGVGSTFHVWFPSRKQAEASSSQEAPESRP